MSRSNGLKQSGNKPAALPKNYLPCRLFEKPYLSTGGQKSSVSLAGPNPSLTCASGTLPTTIRKDAISFLFGRCFIRTDYELNSFFRTEMLVGEFL